MELLLTTPPILLTSVSCPPPMLPAPEMVLLVLFNTPPTPVIVEVPVASSTSEPAPPRVAPPAATVSVEPVNVRAALLVIAPERLTEEALIVVCAAENEAPAFRFTVAPLNASVPEPATAPAIVSVPGSVNVFPRLIDSVPAVELNTPA